MFDWNLLYLSKLRKACITQILFNNMNCFINSSLITHYKYAVSYYYHYYFHHYYQIIIIIISIFFISFLVLLLSLLSFYMFVVYYTFNNMCIVCIRSRKNFHIHWYGDGPSIAMVFHLRRVSDLFYDKQVDYYVICSCCITLFYIVWMKWNSSSSSFYLTLYNRCDYFSMMGLNWYILVKGASGLLWGKMHQ